MLPRCNDSSCLRKTNLPCKHSYSLLHCLLCFYSFDCSLHTRARSHTNTHIRSTFVLPCRTLHRLTVPRTPVLSPVFLFRSAPVQTCCLEICPCCFLFSISCGGFETRFLLVARSVPKRVIPQSVACVSGRD